MLMCQRVQDQVRGVPKETPMCTARPTWLAMSLKEGVYKRSMAQIDVSDLDNVLDIDEERQGMDDSTPISYPIHSCFGRTELHDGPGHA
jgi:hypothetical protein